MAKSGEISTAFAALATGVAAPALLEKMTEIAPRPPV
jgi:hypothetical protein